MQWEPGSRAVLTASSLLAASSILGGCGSILRSVRHAGWQHECNGAVASVVCFCRPYTPIIRCNESSYTLIIRCNDSLHWCFVRVTNQKYRTQQTRAHKQRCSFTYTRVQVLALPFKAVADGGPKKQERINARVAYIENAMTAIEKQNWDTCAALPMHGHDYSHSF
eukprot:SAG11_NODE_1952_length_4011_cov_3.936605_2_plen_166_part_00